jgi:hypothetical protein
VPGPVVSHPIERLRWIARAEGESAAVLAGEAAWTLSELAATEPAALLTACRRLLERHPDCGPLWWTAARLVSGDDALEEGRRAANQLCSDSTPDRLASALRGAVAAGEVILLTVPADISRQALEKGRAWSVRLLSGHFGIRYEMRSLGPLAGGVTGYLAGEEDEALDGASVLVVEALAAAGSQCLVEPVAAGAVEAAVAAGVPAWLVVGMGRALPGRLFERAVAESERRGSGRAMPAGTFALGVGPDGKGEPGAVIAVVTCPPGLDLLRRPV